MRSRGHEVRIVQPLPYAPRWLGPCRWVDLGRAPAREWRGGIPIERPRYLHIPHWARVNARAFATCGLRAIVAGSRPDIVVADYAWPAAVAAHGARRAGLPFVVSGRGSDVLEVAGEAGLRDILGECLRVAGQWCGVSKDLVSRMDELGAKIGHGVLVPNGVDLDLFRIRDQVAARLALGLSGDGELVLVVGYLIPRKDPVLALNTFREWSRTHPDARLAFVGRGPLAESIRREAGRLGLAQRVLFPGECAPEQLALWYGAADVLLFTSRREGRPNVVLEALASGRPVLATEAGGTGELLKGLPALLASEREPITLAQRLENVLNARLAPELLRAQVAGLSWDSSFAKMERCLAAAIGECAHR
jgi:glycosyltransferase involved in cell wall biosynthesis